MATLYPANIGNLRMSHTAAVVASTSFIVYLIFKHIEPDRLTPLFLLLVLIPSCLVPFVHLHTLNIPLSVAATFALYYALILLYITIYRLSPFHPLAKYPGPILNKLSKLWMSYITSTGQQYRYYRRLHEQYGDIVRVGPNELSVNRADAVQPILGTLGMPKGPWWYNRVPPGHIDGLIGQRDPFVHKQRRKPWDRAFSGASLKNYEDIIVKRSRELISQFKKRIGEEIDLAMWMSCFSFDFMGDMVFGASFDLMNEGRDTKRVWKIIEENVELDAIVAHAPWAFSLLRVVPGANTRRLRMFELASSWTSPRIQQGSKTKDLYYYLTDEEGTRKSSITTAASEGVLAIIAGSDTVASTLTALWYYLMRDASMFNRLRAEVDMHFPFGQEPLDFSKMSRMPYLNACINETLRLLPPVLTGVQRSAIPSKLVGTYSIPEGNNISVHTYSLHRNPRCFFPLPDSFWPDRWLPEPDRQCPPLSATKDYGEFVHDTTAFIPFSLGPANCAGKNLALRELRGLVCFIVQTFKFKVKEGFRLESWEEEIADFFVLKKPALPVVVEARH